MYVMLPLPFLYNIYFIINLLIHFCLLLGISYISDDIKSCKKLTQLNLSMNPIGQFPEGVTHLIFLEKLYMSGTMIDFIPANIGRLARLRIFELRDNVITTLPKAFARLTSLICLDIGYNDFTELVSNNFYFSSSVGQRSINSQN